jgi:WS/DGAT/MGAT family acyltransferase
LERISGQVNALPAGVVGLARGLLELGAQTLNLKPSEATLPFQAPASPFNVQTLSSARSYGSCEIPLDSVKAMALASACTVNDVVMTLIDDALHKYLAEHGHPMTVPLVAAMAVSTRTPGQESAGNQVSGELVPMGQPDASVAKRLGQVHKATVKVKKRAQSRSASMRQLHTLLMFGAATLPEITPGLTAAPTYNLLISNMAGPREQLYLGGASLVAFRGMPIVPPNPGLNVTFLSIQSQICLAVGCTPEAMRNPERYIQLLLESLVELERALKPKVARRKRALKKKKPARNTGAKKPALKKVAPKKIAAKKEPTSKAAANRAANKPVKKKVSASKPPGKTSRKVKIVSR